MKDIALPAWEWFKSGEVYSGSMCPDPSIGSLQQTTLHYKAKRVDDRLVAWCYFELPWRTVTNVEETAVARFEGSPFGVEVAENWIRSKCFATQAEPPLLCG